MIISIAKWIIIIFGIYIICAGFIMLFAPQKARQILRKAGSTNVINYTEITLRMVPATGLIVYSDHSKYPEVLHLFGWFMLISALVLYFVPRQIHHNFSLKSADILKPLYFQLISPFAWLFGAALIYSVI